MNSNGSYTKSSSYSDINGTLYLLEMEESLQYELSYVFDTFGVSRGSESGNCSDWP